MDLVELSGRPKDKFIQFALDREKVKWNKVSWPQLISEKIDGVFCLAFKNPYLCRVEIYSRTGEGYTSMKHIEKILYQIMDWNEIIIFEACGPMGTLQSTVSGWARDTKEQHPELCAGCHDLLTLEEFLKGGDKPFIDRHVELCKRIESWCNNKTKDQYWTVFRIGHQHCHSLEEAERYAENIVSGEGEGAVLKNPQGLYSPGKRNQDIIKLKKGVSFDLKVLGVLEGEGKYKGTLGALLCKWKDIPNESLTQTIRISGMTDAQRHEWWEDSSKIIGKIVQVDAMCLSSKGLLREPRFKGIREDKTKGDF
jgi:ATP-dependent DNA ligase